MEITDLPTLFQLTIAQDSTLQHMEVLDQIIETQQTEIEHLKKLANSQQDLLEEITHYIKSRP